MEELLKKCLELAQDENSSEEIRMQISAKQLFKMKKSFEKAGFTSEESFELLKTCMLKAE